MRDTDADYVRNSVKAVVDAYDGTVDLYLTDSLYGKKDPIIRAYAAAFPKLFKPFDADAEGAAGAPAVSRGHVPDADDDVGPLPHHPAENFYDASDQWDVAQDPGTDVDRTHGERRRRRPDVIDPYYLLMQLPDSKDVDYLLFRPFVPHSTDDSKKQLTVVHGGHERRR